MRVFGDSEFGSAGIPLVSSSTYTFAPNSRVQHLRVQTFFSWASTLYEPTTRLIQLTHTESKHAQLHMHMRLTQNIFTSKMLHESAMLISHLHTKSHYTSHLHMKSQYIPDILNRALSILYEFMFHKNSNNKNKNKHNDNNNDNNNNISVLFIITKFDADDKPKFRHKNVANANPGIQAQN